MGVFDNSVKVGRRVKDPLTDKKLAGSGSLSWGSITTVTGLAQTTGVDCKLVHGDRWQEILGNMNEHYTLNVNTTIDQNWTIQVNGIMNLTVVQGYNETELGPVNRTYWQVVNDTFLSDHNVTVPASASFQVSMFSNTVTIAEAIGIVVGPQLVLACTLCVTLALLVDLEYKTLHAEFHPLHGDGKLVELYAVEAKVKLHGDEAEVGAKTNVKASVNAGVDVDAGVPLT
jgi:hypothetical protein